MSPSAVDPPINNDVESLADNRKETNVSTSVKKPLGNYILTIALSSLSMLAYLLIGFTVGISLFFALSNGLPLGSTQLHIILCVTGYHLLMAVGILSQAPKCGFGAVLTLRDRNRTHTVLQIIGSGLAIAGSFIKITNKEHNFHTLHGKFALVALVFTLASLINGLTSLYAFEWRRCLPGNLSKLTHICFGTVAFTTGSITLCLGLDKVFFRSWANEAFSDTLIIFVGISTVIVIFNPIITFFKKSLNVIRK